MKYTTTDIPALIERFENWDSEKAVSYEPGKEPPDVVLLSAIAGMDIARKDMDDAVMYARGHGMSFAEISKMTGVDSKVLIEHFA
ncbi:MAG: hypothetical protein LBB58_02740 [Cellulomonadaceae bacterium]|jgi:hypothetical protein|nr:hypothetical protein [Cellulomonadaceae bacterium]